MTSRAYQVELEPTARQRHQLIRTTAACRRAYNWALETWLTWAGARAMAIGMRALAGHDEEGARAACALAQGMAALDWRHGPKCPRAAGKKKCTKVTCDKRSIFEQRYEPYPSQEAIHSLLVQAMRSDPELAWLREVSSYAIREAVIDLGSAFERFGRVVGKHGAGDHSECGIRPDGKCALGFPTWRTRGHASWHADQPASDKNKPIEICPGQHGVSARVKIPGVSDSAPETWVKIKGGRLPPPEARLGAIGVSERAGRWFASLRFDAPLPAVAPRVPGSVLGVETGVRELAVTSNGQRFDAVRDLRALQKAERRLRLWQRRLSRRAQLDAAGRLLGGVAGQSKGWHEAKRQVQQCHLAVTFARKNLLHQTSRAVVDLGAETVVMRDQAVRRMLARGQVVREQAAAEEKSGPQASKRPPRSREKRNRLAPLIQQCGGLYELRRQVTYKQEWAGGTVRVVPSAEPTTRRCHHCDAVRETEPGYGRPWQCGSCGAPNDRELNAARNLRDWTAPSTSSIGGNAGEVGGGARRRKASNG